ncbi:LTA synthase family protein [Ornithinimicrobium cerasi]|uniref:LTA synthase family protein n=1 Tax=Ornithinimicrobium cerasi TaxID=2248773 RepID=UPI000F002792|nr:LTA synthase family protein [Ornithinimicrobium cerasi]
MLLLVPLALVLKSVIVAAAVLEPDGWAALVVLTAVPLLLLLLSPALLLHGRARTAYLVGVDLLVTLLLVGDLVNARVSGRLLSVHMLSAAGTFEGLGSSVLDAADWPDLLLFADLLAVAVLALAARGRDRRAARTGSVPRLRARGRAVAVVAPVALLAFVAQLLLQTSDPGLRVAVLSPLGTHAHQAWDQLIDDNEALTPEERERVSDWFAANAAYHQAAPEHEDLVGLLEGRDVYLVVLESLEQVVLGARPYGQEVTPTLNSWVEESLVFDAVQEQVRDGNSSDAELLMLAGVYPLRSGAAFLRFPDNAGYTTLPGLLAEEGYRPVALHADAATFWNRHVVYPHLGFERYVAEDDFAVGGREVGMGLADEDLFDQALREVDRLPSPRFLHLVTLTSHTPWHLPEDLQGLELPDDDATSRYLQSVHYADAALGEFARQLDERGLLDTAAIVVVGDHRGPHKYAREDERWLTGDDGRVPFLVHVPGMDGRRISTPGGQVDVLPTLAQLLGIPAERYAGSVMGRTLLGTHSGSAVTPDGTVLPGADGAGQLAEAYEIADLAVSGDWFTQ